MKKQVRNFISLVFPAVFMSVLMSHATLQAQTKQEHVHKMSHTVMPFEMSKTIHIFKMTEFGGVMRVIIKAPSDSDQIPLIQQHLKHETMQFQKGIFSDPVKLHGPDMPGIRNLEAGADRIKVSYGELSNGAKIRFETNDLHLVTAVHRWFGAQLSEHGADARAE